MIKVRVNKSYATHGYDVWVFDYATHSRFERENLVAKPVKLEFVKMEEWSLPEPTFQLESAPKGNAEEFLKALVEGILEAGLAPMLSHDNAKQVEAMKEHLKDLKDAMDKMFHLAKNEPFIKGELR